MLADITNNNQLVPGVRLLIKWNMIEFIIKSKHSQFAMQNQPTANPQPLIFEPTSLSVAAQLKEDSICLHANVFTDPLHTQQLRIAMTNFYLAVCSPHSHFSQYLFHCELQFDLKFQVLYSEKDHLQQQLTSSSKKVGFRLFKEEQAQISLYFKSQPLLEIWLKYLSRNLNQWGFHKLYKPVRKLGKGGFATVYEVERLTDKTHFAAKAFSKSSTINSSNPNNKIVLLNEIEMLRTFESPNIMKLEAIFESQNSIYIILELLGDGQLHSRINQRMARFTEEEVKSFMRGMTKGLYQMHKYKVMHRDIKPENIMLRGKNGLSPVIADFGLAADTESNDYLFYRCGTPGYVAPEIITCQKGQKLSTSCDIFSLGLIFHILLVKRPLFEGRSSDQVYENNRKCSFNLNSSFYERVEPQAMSLLKKMLALDPKERITAEEMLHHPFLFQAMDIQCDKQVISPATTATSNGLQNFGEAENAF